MCLWRAPEKYIAGAKAPAGTALDRVRRWLRRYDKSRKVAG
jgi:Zn ribbon nucleic-acid-binding protein